MVKSKRLEKAGRMSVKKYLDRIKADAAKVAMWIKKMPTKKKVMIAGGVALTGVTGYLIVRAYTKKFDGKRFYLRGYTKSKRIANDMAEALRKKGLNVRIAPIVTFKHVIYRLYARKA